MRSGPTGRYFFHLRNDIDADDLEGVELPDDRTALDRAGDYAIEMAAASVLERRTVILSHCIIVTKEAGKILKSVNFGDVLTVER